MQPINIIHTDLNGHETLFLTRSPRRQRPWNRRLVRSCFSLAAVVVINGVALGDSGDLLVSNFGNDKILQYNTAPPAFIGEFVAAGSGGLDGPWDATFGPDGNLYVASVRTDSILRFDGSTGAFIDVFASGGGLDGPISAVFGPDGNLYVNGAANLQVRRFNGATGAFIDVFTVGRDLNVPRGMVFGPDGNLYVAHFDHNVVRFSGATGSFIDVFVETGSGGLESPGDLAFGPDGNLYVASRDSNAIIRYDRVTGAFLDVFAIENRPIGIVFGEDGFLYVSDTQFSSALERIAQFNGLTGEFVSVIASGVDATFLTFVPPQVVDERICICHVSPGNPANAHTICVGPAAIHAHLAHGDARGSCPSVTSRRRPSVHRDVDALVSIGTHPEIRKRDDRRLEAVESTLNDVTDPNYSPAIPNY